VPCRVVSLEHTVRVGGLLARVAQDRIVELERFGKLAVRFSVVGARREVSYLEFADPVKALGNQATTTVFVPAKSASL
jgi:hypothetical protein